MRSRWFIFTSLFHLLVLAYRNCHWCFRISSQETGAGSCRSHHAKFGRDFVFFLEAFVLELGPRRAALPFCIVFFFNQAIATVLILAQLQMAVAPSAAKARQVTIKTLIVGLTSFSIFFGIARQLLRLQHDWLMSIALGLLGITAVGITMLLYNWSANSKVASLSPSSVNRGIGF